MESILIGFSLGMAVVTCVWVGTVMFRLIRQVNSHTDCLQDLEDDMERVKTSFHNSTEWVERQFDTRIDGLERQLDSRLDKLEYKMRHGDNTNSGKNLIKG